MKKDKKEARAKGLEDIELDDTDLINHKDSLEAMKEHDRNIDEESIEKEYQERRVQPSKKYKTRGLEEKNVFNEKTFLKEVIVPTEKK
jgi:hypothetical protein